MKCPKGCNRRVFDQVCKKSLGASRSEWMAYKQRVCTGWSRGDIKALAHIRRKVSNQIYSIKSRQAFSTDASAAAAKHAELTAENTLLREQNAKLHREKNTLYVMHPDEFPGGAWASKFS